MNPTLPSHTHALIIGGGIIGTSVAYHLAKLGCKDVLLLERHKLTSGSTFHAAGLVGQLRSSANITQLLKYSVELYASLSKETGVETGWKMNGGLRLACTEDRMTELKRQATTARSFGLPMHILTPGQAKEVYPIMDISDCLGAAFLPTDGQVNPSDLTQAFAKGARAMGVQIIEECPVTGFSIQQNEIRSVKTDKGSIRSDIVVNCAGQWAKEVGRFAHVDIPMTSVQHQYLITEPIADIPNTLPTLRDPDRLLYFKEEVGGLSFGGYEHNPIPWAEHKIPENFAFSLLSPNWEQFEPLLKAAMLRVPSLATAQIRELINGPESFTPDGNFILGQTPSLKNFYVGTGFNAFGIASAGGAGRALAEWIIEGEPTLDLWPVDIRRFHHHHGNNRWVRERTLELYGKHYSMSWPQEEHESARPIRVSPLYLRLKAENACFGEKLGWERPNWFAPRGMEPKDVPSFDYPSGFEHIAKEHHATRERVTLFDQSSFSKFLLIGKNAEKVLSWICANTIQKPTGSIIYTQMCNAKGGIECDLTLTRLNKETFYIVTGTGFATHDSHWICSHLLPGEDVHWVDVTSAYATLALMGPLSRLVLQSLVDEDISNEALPFGQLKNISIGGAPVKALRVTYVGELGFELHIPSEYALGIYERLISSGAPYGILNAGYRAIESLRLEKGYRAWGADIGPDYTPLEAGLEFAVKFEGGRSFLGREALEVQKREGVKKKLVCFTYEGQRPMLWGRESIYRNDKCVGWLTSGGYGHTVQKNIGYGYVRHTEPITQDFLRSGEYALEVAAEKIPCQIQLEPLYDPKMERVKG